MSVACAQHFGSMTLLYPHTHPQLEHNRVGLSAQRRGEGLQFRGPKAQQAFDNSLDFRRGVIQWVYGNTAFGAPVNQLDDCTSFSTLDICIDVGYLRPNTRPPAGRPAPPRPTPLTADTLPCPPRHPPGVFTPGTHALVLLSATPPFPNTSNPTLSPMPFVAPAP